MRFPSPPVSISRTARSLALFALALVLFAMGGACEDKHVGRPCELGTIADGRQQRPDRDGLVAGAGVPEPHLPSARRREGSRSPAQITAMVSGTGPLCTASCESTEDCEDGETGQRRQRGRQALPQRVRLHLADDGRQLRLPADVRLSRLLLGAARRREEAALLRQLAVHRGVSRAMLC